MPAEALHQWRRGTAAQWTAANPVLADGEPGFERDTKRVKVGNGVDAWSLLPYATTLAETKAPGKDPNNPDEFYYDPAGPDSGHGIVSRLVVPTKAGQAAAIATAKAEAIAAAAADVDQEQAARQAADDALSASIAGQAAADHDKYVRVQEGRLRVGEALAIPDTGWDATPFASVNNGWTIEAGHARRWGPLVDLRFRCRWNGPQIPAHPQGDIQDMLIGTVEPQFASFTAAALSHGHFGWNFTGMIIGDDVFLTNAIPGHPMLTGAIFSLQGTFMVP